MDDRITWNHLTMCKYMSSSSFRNNVADQLFHLQIMYIWYVSMYKQDLALKTYKGWHNRKPNHESTSFPFTAEVFTRNHQEITCMKL